MFGWCGAGWLCLSVGFALDGATLVGFFALSLSFHFPSLLLLFCARYNKKAAPLWDAALELSL